MIPPKTHPTYRKLALGEISPDLSNLGLKILLGRVKLSTSRDSSPKNVEAQVDSIHEFFVRNEALASKDLKTIFP